MLQLGIIGTAKIAHAFAEAVQVSSKIKIAAVASRTQENATLFAQKFNIAKAYSSYHLLLDDKAIEAVYIPLPNTLHAEWAIKAAHVKKHILCEKPLATTAEEINKMYAAAEQNEVLLMEGFPYRHQPQTIEMLAMIARGDIGNVLQVYADFGFTVSDIENNIRLKPELGGGAMWDAGAYPVSIIRAITGQPPVDIFAYGNLNEQQLDVSVSALLKHENGIIAQLNCNFFAGTHRYIRVIGTNGTIACGYYNNTNPTTAVIEIKRGTGWSWEFEKNELPSGNGFLLEAEAFCKNIENFKKYYSGTTQQESIDNAATILSILKSVQLKKPLAQ
jgi:D-xylose 1-dehydrogenase (NADP+, D-xylono-1,5-lactone-forming)